MEGPFKTKANPVFKYAAGRLGPPKSKGRSESKVYQEFTPFPINLTTLYIHLIEINLKVINI
jgi:hypothetical protein